MGLFEELGDVIRPEKRSILQQQKDAGVNLTPSQLYELGGQLPMGYVYLCSPTNSQMFTTCCHVAICSDQQRCPKCHRYIYGHDYHSCKERGDVRWRYAFRR